MKQRVLVTSFAFVNALMFVRFPMQSDDPMFYFFNIFMSEGSYARLLSYSINEGFSQGHSNPLGAILSHSVGYIHYLISSEMSLKPWLVFGILRISLMLITLALLINTVNLTSRNQNRIQNSLVVTFVFFGTLQIHSPWSHDYIVSVPTIGLLTPILILIQINLTIRLLKNAQSRKLLLLLILNSFISIFIYELHLVTLFTPFLIYYLAKFTLKMNFLATKARYIPLITLSIFSCWLLARLIFAENSSGYPGTQFGSLDMILRTSIFNVLSTLPGSSWKLASKFVQLNPMQNIDFSEYVIFLTLVAIIILIMIYLFKVNSKKVIIGVIIIVYLNLSTAILHGLSVKNYNDVGQIGMVYFSYGVGFISLTFLIANVIIETQKFLPLLIKSLFTMFFILFYFNQYFINYEILQKQKNDYAVYENLISYSIQLDSSEDKRCSEFKKWHPEFNRNDYYMVIVMKGFDEISRRDFGAPFCRELYNENNE